MASIFYDHSHSNTSLSQIKRAGRILFQVLGPVELGRRTTNMECVAPGRPHEGDAPIRILEVTCVCQPPEKDNGHDQLPFEPYNMSYLIPTRY